MRHLLLFFLFSAVAVTTSAQIYDVDLDYTVVKSYCGWKSKSQVHIDQVMHEEVRQEGTNLYWDRYFLISDADGQLREVKGRFDGAMDCHYKNVEDLWNDLIIGNVLTMIQKKGTQVSLRNEMEEDALEFISRMRNANGDFSDPYLESYLYSLVAKIAPAQLIDGRPGNVNLIILDDASMNAFTFANGTIAITTGLLSALHSEDELVAVLSHEIAHFILDHSVANVNAAAARQKRAEFWAAMATMAVAVGEGVAASKNQYYTPGAATAATAVLSSEIANSVIDRLGMKYNHEQELEADQVAQKVLKLLGYNENALATALHRIFESYQLERSKAMYFSSETHPELSERIKSLGGTTELKDPAFEKMISFAVTNAALGKYGNCRYRQVLPLVQQNIDNHVATADDYILKANCLLYLKNDDQSNKEAHETIGIAKKIDSNNINIYKVEIITALRLNQKENAKQLLVEYQDALNGMRNNLSSIGSAHTWDASNHFISTELDWSDKMLIKLNGM